MSIGKVLPAAQFANIGPIGSGEMGKSSATPGIGNKDESFGDMIMNGIRKTDATIKEFEQSTKALANGETVNIHELMVKGEQADVTLRLMTALRSKIVEAYQEVMHLQV